VQGSGTCPANVTRNVRKKYRTKKELHFHRLHPEERGHPLVICGLHLARTDILLLDFLLQNQVGKGDSHILPIKRAEHIFLISDGRLNVR
jgi:hypothetical protein